MSSMLGPGSPGSGSCSVSRVRADRPSRQHGPTNEATSHPLPGSVPVFNATHDRLRAVLESHRLGSLASAWGDPQWTACLKCADCEVEMEAADDLMLVRRMDCSRRAKLMAAGIKTMSLFAAGDLPGVGIKMDLLWVELLG